MTVFENVAFPMIHGRRRPPRDEVRTRIMHALAPVRLDRLADRAAPFLSGGQQQPVALARAFVHEPPILLFDDPLSNLDAKLREEMRVELRELTTSLGMTTIYVTHDQIEALAMSDRIALMRDGRIVQEGASRDVYFHLSDAFVAEFPGSSNILRGHLIDYDADKRRAIVDSPSNGEGSRVRRSGRPGHQANQEHLLGEVWCEFECVERHRDGGQGIGVL